MLGSLASIFGLAFALHRWGRLPSAACPAVACGLLIIALYGCALAGILQSGALVIYAIGLACLAYELFAAFRTRRFRYPLVEVLVPVFLCVAVYWRLSDATFIVWDDFSHWGLASREMLARHRLTDLSSILMMQSYPPGASLFHYFCAMLTQRSEGAIIIAHAWLLILPLTGLLFQASWRHVLAIGAAVGGIWLVVDVLGLGLQTAMVDHTLSACFAGAVICYFILERSGCSPLWTAPILFALPLIKAPGVLLALSAALVMSVDILLLHLTRKDRRQTLRRLVTVLVLFAVPLAAAVSWKFYCDAKGVDTEWTVPKFSVSELTREFSSQASDKARLTTDNFVRALQARGVSQLNHGAFALPQWTAILVCMIALSLLFGSFGIQRYRLAAAFGVLCIGFVGYLGWLLTTYVVIFGSIEGPNLTSFPRYVNSYLAAMVAVAIFWTLGSRVVVRGRAVVPRGVLAAVVVGALFFFQTPSFAILNAPQPDAFRREFKPLLQRIAAIIPPDKGVITIYQGSVGSEIWRIRFDLAPRPYREAWSFGEPYRPGDPYTMKLSPAELTTVLGRGDYVFLARVDARFWETYGGLFAPEDRHAGASLYRVERMGSGGIKLTAEVDAKNQKILIPRNAERLIVPNATGLIEDSQITPFPHPVWLSMYPPTRVENGGIKIEGLATTSYFATSNPYRLPKGALLAATVNARRGGIALGLIDPNGRWVSSVAVPVGQFRAVVQAPEDGTYHIVLAQNSTGVSYDVEIPEIGLLGGLRPDVPRLESKALEEKRPSVTAATDLLDRPTINGLTKPDWHRIFPPTQLDGGVMKLAGAATEPYLAVSVLYQLPKGALVAASGAMKAGSLVLGLLNAKEEWVPSAKVVISPGPFLAAVQVPEAGEYRIAVTTDPAVKRKEYDAVITQIGFLGGLQPAKKRGWWFRLWPG